MAPRLQPFSLLPAALAVVLSGVWSSLGFAAPPLHDQIDQHITAARSDYEQIAAPVADDAEFLRRVYLDLVGSIPSVDQVRAFLADSAADKRARWVDQLLASPEHARHLQKTFDVLLMRRLPNKHVPQAEWEKFLRESFAANKPWDEIVRTLFITDGADPAHRGPARFLLDRDADVTVVTRDVSKLLFGANLECAQCHDHPSIPDFKQQHYYGVAAFFNRSFVFAGKDQPVVLAEKADGEVAFESVFEIRDKTSTGAKSTAPRLFTSAPITDPSFAKPEDAYAVAPADNVRPVPRFSRRAKFAEFAITAENRRFARTTVNRVWALLLGRGIVHPVDQDHNDNRPSHPALLSLLTDEFATSGMNLRSLVREIVLSKTYQRSSRMPDGRPLPPAESFAIGSVRELSPSQFCMATLQASGFTDMQRIALGATLNEETLHAQLAAFEPNFVNYYGGQPGKPPERFESTTTQTLWFSNNATPLSLCVPQNGTLADRMLKIPAENPRAIADELYLSALTRPPTDEEAAEVEQYLAGLVAGPRMTACGELIWATISSAEFRFNH